MSKPRQYIMGKAVTPCPECVSLREELKRMKDEHKLMCDRLYNLERVFVKLKNDSASVRPDARLKPSVRTDRKQGEGRKD